MAISQIYILYMNSSYHCHILDKVRIFCVKLRIMKQESPKLLVRA